MVELIRKGQRLEIPSSQIVTFKKSINLNGVQDRYSYSNTLSLDKTANIKKLLDLTDLPTGKARTLQNGFEVDVVFNGAIRLRNQILKITKETTNKVELYLLFSDNALVSKLKSTYINETAKLFQYKKTRDDFQALKDPTANPAAVTAFVQTQSPAGKYVVEEMPILINVRELVKKMFSDNNYTVYGDFLLDDNTIGEYYCAPNSGIYQVYSGAGEGFSPSFDASLTAFDFLNQVLAFFNCYASVDDTFRTVIINQWTNLGNFKNNFVDFSKYFVESQDYIFQSRLAKRNELTYSDTDTTFNSFFTNTLASDEKAVYLASKFGSGSTLLFDDAEVQEDGTIPLRAANEVGETSAVRIYKLAEFEESADLYQGGTRETIFARRATSVSMREVYNRFHKGYTDFILTPLIQNITLRYDDILAADFDLTRVFFIEQLASYWIPLEINFSTKRDKIMVKCMLIKSRKVVAPILNNFNSVLLDFRQKVIFPKTLLLSMYPMPPNENNWQDVIFKRYDQDRNSLYIDGVLVPSAALPQAYDVTLLNEDSIVIEANKVGDVTPDRLSDSLFLQAVDTNGGVSNEAYINLVHTGVASLESNFQQLEKYVYTRNSFDIGFENINVLTYYVGPKPNLNNTVNNVGVITSPTLTNAFNLIQALEFYPNVKIDIPAFEMFLFTKNVGIGKARANVKLIVTNGAVSQTLHEISLGDDAFQTFEIPAKTFTFASVAPGQNLRVYFAASFDNRRGSNSGAMDVRLEIEGFKTNISTIKTV